MHFCHASGSRSWTKQWDGERGWQSHWLDWKPTGISQVDDWRPTNCNTSVHEFEDMLHLNSPSTMNKFPVFKLSSKPMCNLWWTRSHNWATHSLMRVRSLCPWVAKMLLMCLLWRLSMKSKRLLTAVPDLCKREAHRSFQVSQWDHT